MHFKHGRHLTSCILMLCLLVPLRAQVSPRNIDRVNAQLISYFQENGPDWEHDTVAPLIAPGSQPGGNVVIHHWRSKKCLTTDVIIGGERHEAVPVYCSVKVAIYQYVSAEAAHAHLSEFVEFERMRKTPWKLMPLRLGDEGYLWNRSKIVFRKGEFSFWLSSVIGDSYGRDQFDMAKEATESFAKEVVKALRTN